MAPTPKGPPLIDPSNPSAAPFANWSPVPGQIPNIREPTLNAPICPLLPLSCGPCSTGKCVVPAQQPVVPVPVYQEIRRRDRIVEVPQTIIKDKIVPKLHRQEVYYDVPDLDLHYTHKPIQIPRVEFKEKLIEVPVPVRFNYKIISKWEIREVPRLIPKYVGEQEKIFVEIPQVRIEDKRIEKEVPIYVGEKVVKKEVVEEEPIDIIQYQYVERQEEVPVYKYKPVFDVEVEIPPPLIVPVPVQPREVQLEPERVSLAHWKHSRQGGTSACCNDHNLCGVDPAQPSFCKCSACCQPGGIMSAGGFFSSICGKSLCRCCQGTGCSACCIADTGATSNQGY